jgi:hypothetical protein
LHLPCAVPHATPIMAKFFNISHLVEKRRQKTRRQEKRRKEKRRHEKNGEGRRGYRREVRVGEGIEER